MCCYVNVLLVGEFFVEIVNLFFLIICWLRFVLIVVVSGVLVELFFLL